MTPLLCPDWWAATSFSFSMTTTRSEGKRPRMAIAVESPTMPPPMTRTPEDDWLTRESSHTRTFRSCDDPSGSIDCRARVFRLGEAIVFEVAIDHLVHELAERHLVGPAENGLRARTVGEQVGHLGRAMQLRIDHHVLGAVETDALESNFQEFADGMNLL